MRAHGAMIEDLRHRAVEYDKIRGAGASGINERDFLRAAGWRPRSTPVQAL